MTGSYLARTWGERAAAGICDLDFSAKERLRAAEDGRLTIDVRRGTGTVGSLSLIHIFSENIVTEGSRSLVTGDILYARANHDGIRCAERLRCR